MKKKTQSDGFDPEATQNVLLVLPFPHNYFRQKSPGIVIK